LSTPAFVVVVHAVEALVPTVEAVALSVIFDRSPDLQVTAGQAFDLEEGRKQQRGALSGQQDRIAGSGRKPMSSMVIFCPAPPYSTWLSTQFLLQCDRAGDLVLLPELRHLLEFIVCGFMSMPPNNHHVSSCVLGVEFDLLGHPVGELMRAAAPEPPASVRAGEVDAFRSAHHAALGSVVGGCFVGAGLPWRHHRGPGAATRRVPPSPIACHGP
jgi:hypothetical protein